MLKRKAHERRGQDSADVSVRVKPLSIASTHSLASQQPIQIVSVIEINMPFQESCNREPHRQHRPVGE